MLFSNSDPQKSWICFAILFFLSLIVYKDISHAESSERELQNITVSKRSMENSQLKYLCRFFDRGCNFIGTNSASLEGHITRGCPHKRRPVLLQRNATGKDGDNDSFRLKKRRKLSSESRLPVSLGGNDPRLEIDCMTAEPSDADAEILAREREFQLQEYVNTILQKEDQTAVGSNNIFQQNFEDLDEMAIDKILIEQANKDDLTEAYAVLLSSLQGAPLSERSINRIMMITMHSKFDAAHIQPLFHNLRGAKLWLKKKEEDSYEQQGFEKVKITLEDESGECYIWIKNAEQILKEQIEGAAPNEIAFSFSEELTNEGPSSERLFKYPMSGNLAKEAFPLVENFLKFDTPHLPDVTWHTGLNNGKRSFVGGLQMFTDGTATSLSAGAQVFHPLNITLINFTHEYREKLALKGKCVVALLPTEIEWADCDHGSRSKRMKLLHAAISRALFPVKEKQLSGIIATTKDGVERVMHTVISLVVTDAPEGKDLASVSGAYTVCTRCHKDGDEFACCSLSGLHDSDFYARDFGSDTELRTEYEKALLEGRYEDSKLAEDELGKRNLTKVKPFCSDWYFVDGALHSLLSFYACIAFERMHNIPLGIAKTTFEAIWTRLGCPDLSSSAFVTKANKERTFNLIRTKTLASANEMLEWIDKYSPVQGFRANFSSGKSTEALNGFFTKYGIVGMLEARDMRCIIEVSPFIGALIDRMCGEEDSAPCTTVLTLLAEIYASVYGLTRVGDTAKIKQGHTERDLISLLNLIREMKEETAENFGDWQKSGFNTLKFHFLDHLIADILRLASTRAMGAEVWEAAHKAIKVAFRATSRRKSTAVKETVERLQGEDSNEATSNARDHVGALLRYGHHKYARRKPVRGISELLTGDSASLVSSGIDVKLGRLEDCIDQSRRNKSTFAKENEIAIEETLVRSAGVEVMEAFLELVCSLQGFDAVRNSKVGSFPPGYSVKIVNSGVAAGSGCPNSDSIIEGLSQSRELLQILTITKAKRREVQKVVASFNYYGRPRHDHLIIEYEESNLSASLSKQLQGKRVVTIAKALLFIRMKPESSSETKEEEFVFVQYYTPDTAHKQETIEKLLGCVRLKWATNDQNKEYYDLLPINAVRGKVQLVRGDIGLNLLRADESASGSATSPLVTEFFYINRFNSRIGGDSYDAE